VAESGLSIPIDGLVEMIDEFGAGVYATVAEQGMLRLGNTLEALSVELAPHDIGDLEASTTVRVEDKGKRIIASVTFNVSHAAAAHENPEDARGPRTRRKPGNNLGPAGPKYMERPLRFMQDAMSKNLGKALIAFWRGAEGGRRGAGRRRSGRRRR
jgi:hypothetical protein